MSTTDAPKWRFEHAPSQCRMKAMSEHSESELVTCDCGSLHQPCGARSASVPWWTWFLDLWGKVRRFYLVRWHKDYVREKLALRRGECRRCAGCCSIAFRCPHLKGNVCMIYEKRYRQCAAFPIDERDLKYRNCGFYFAKSGSDTGSEEGPQGR